MYNICNIYHSTLILYYIKLVYAIQFSIDFTQCNFNFYIFLMFITCLYCLFVKLDLAYHVTLFILIYKCLLL